MLPAHSSAKKEGLGTRLLSTNHKATILLEGIRQGVGKSAGVVLIREVTQGVVLDREVAQGVAFDRKQEVSAFGRVRVRP